MTDELELMLINVLLDQFFNIKVSQGSVATRLRCDGILNDQFIAQSLLSPRVKKMKIGQHLPKLWAIKYRVVFYETRCRNKSITSKAMQYRQDIITRMLIT